MHYKPVNYKPVNYKPVNYKPHKQYKLIKHYKEYKQ